MTRTHANTFAASGILIIAVTLLAWGQPMICTCGYIAPWISSIFHSGNSQHIADWYTLSHILHGVLVTLAGRLFFPQISAPWLLAIAALTGIAWEIVEHTEWVLGAFRATTINQGYYGDSVLNAVMDYIFMLGGFFAARALPTLWVIVLVVVLELTAAIFGRDSMVLSTLMLVYPIEAVNDWQQELNPLR
ncbi:DUF2585 family protein [Yoonia sp. 208BN28-4]|uniref:DUF2585 family protein n=1 Tax=Yoonia sp. 208BN28-4 TaxID=3126505 RepID=UPI0030A7DB26